MTCSWSLLCPHLFTILLASELCTTFSELLTDWNSRLAPISESLLLPFPLPWMVFLRYSNGSSLPPFLTKPTLVTLLKVTPGLPTPPVFLTRCLLFPTIFITFWPDTFYWMQAWSWQGYWSALFIALSWPTELCLLHNCKHSQNQYKMRTTCYSTIMCLKSFWLFKRQTRSFM